MCVTQWLEDENEGHHSKHIAKLCIVLRFITCVAHTLCYMEHRKYTVQDHWYFIPTALMLQSYVQCIYCAI